MKKTILIIMVILLSGQSIFAQWSLQNSGTTNNLTSVNFINANVGWAVGAAGKIIYTANGGTSWGTQISGVANQLNSVSFSGSLNGLIAGSGGKILMTSDGGLIWQTINSGTAGDLYGIFSVSTTVAIAVGDNGKIIKTTDGGLNWTSKVSGTTDILWSVFFVDANTGWAVGGHFANGTSKILKTINGGESWTAQASPTTLWLYSVSFSDSQNGWAVGPNGTIVATSNGGTNWVLQPSGEINEWFYGCGAASGSNVWVGGSGGLIKATTNGGTNWSAQTSGITDALRSFSFVNTTTGWAVGDAGKVLKYSPVPSGTVTVTSPNGGENWKVGSSQNITWTSSSVTNVKLEYSADNGTSWTQIVASTPAAAATYAWTIPNSNSTQALVRVSDAANNTIKDQSNAVFTIYTPTVSVTSPNGGESWKAGSSPNITWTSSNITNVKLEYSADNGTSWTQIVASTAASSGTYSWTVPNTNTSQALIRVSDASDNTITDLSNVVFTIYTPSVTVTSPNGGENWKVGSSQNITWSSSNVTNVKLEYSVNNGTGWTQIVASTPSAAGTYAWTIPNSNTTQALVRVSDASDNAIIDQSNAVFTIHTPTITVISPNGGEEWKVGTNKNITWTSSYVTNVKLEYSVDSGSNWTTIITSTPANTGIYSWTIPNSTTSTALVRVTDTSDNTVKDQSNNVFRIYNQTVSVLFPNGGENWKAGSVQAITWIATNIPNVKIEYSIDNGSSWTQIAASVISNIFGLPNYYSWTVPSVNTTQALVRISDVTDNTIVDQSNAVFSIYLPTVTLTSPNGGENWKGGTTQNISWTSSNVTNVKLEYSADNGTSWTQIAASTSAGTGSYSWLIPDLNSGNLLVRISDVLDNNINDTSNAVFTIYTPTITVTSPNESEKWRLGTVHNITWTSVHVTNVKIEYSPNNGTSWVQIIGSTPANSGGYSWTVPSSAIASCKVRISDVSDSNIKDESDSFFSIVRPILYLSKPNGGESFVIGSQAEIWWSMDYVNNVKIEYTTNNGAAWNSIINNMAANVQRYTWTIPSNASTDCKVRISDAADSTVNDISDNSFTIISPMITLTNPNGGESWTAGTTKNITWTRNYNWNNVKIEYTTNNGSSWNLIVGSHSASSQSYSWIVPNIPSTQCKVKITDLINPSVKDSSDNVFTILSVPSLTLTSPNGGELFQVGKSYNITWNSVSVNSVKLYVSTNSGGFWTYIGTSDPGTNSFTWEVFDHTSLPPGENCKIKIVDAQNGSVLDVSDATFTICKYYLLTPVSNDLWRAGSTRQITWVSNMVYAKTRIELSYDNGSTWSVLVDSTVTTPGTSNVNVPLFSSQLCRVRISIVNHPEINSVSIGSLTIYGLELTAPAGGEVIRGGSRYEIKWNEINMNFLKLECSLDNGLTWQGISDNVPASVQSYMWTVPNTSSNAAKVRISNKEDLRQTDVSQNNFSIVVPTISLQNPNGGEVFLGGSFREIKWNASNARNVKLEYTFDNGRNWLVIEDSIASTPSTYLWNVPSLTSSNCKIRVTDILNNITDESDNKFSISLTGITVLSPNGGEKWQSNSVHEITWISSNVTTIKLEYSTDNGSSWSQIPNASSIQAELGLYSWTLPNISSLLCKVRVTSTINSSYSDQSDLAFSISSLVVTSPNNGDKWQALTQHNITWTSSNIQNVKLDYSTDNGSNWLTIVSNLSASSGSYNWTLPNLHQTNCKIKISDVSNPGIYDESTGVFSIYRFKVVVVSPNGGEVWQAGKTKNIRWNSYDVNQVKIYYSTNLGVNWMPIALGVNANDGNYDWLIPADVKTTTGLIKIQASNNSTFKDSSDYQFTIARLILTSPNGGETLEADSIRTITWVSNNISNVDFEFTSDGINWNPINDNKVEAVSAQEFTWLVPNISSDNCKIRIKSSEHSTIMDVSENSFSITSEQWIGIITPFFGTKWYINTPQRISWLSFNLGSVKISYSSDNGITWNIITNSTSASKGYYDWTPTTAALEYTIKIEGINSRAKVESIQFSVLGVPELTLSSPNGGESFESGNNVLILWSSSNVLKVDIQYRTSSNGVWENIAEDVPAQDRQYTWTLPKINSSDCKVRISAVDKPQLEDLSNSTFAIVTKAAILKSPNGGELLQAGSNYQITWEKQGNSQNISIDYSNNGGGRWIRVATNISSAAESYIWTVPNISSSTCLVRIITTNYKLATLIDQSESSFMIYTESQDQLWYVSEGNTAKEKCYLTDDLGFGLNHTRTGSWSSTSGDQWAYQLLKTTDGGKTWPNSEHNYDYLYGYAHLFKAKDNSAVIAIGSDGGLRIRSSSTYYSNYPRTSFQATSACFLNTNTGYLIGSKGGVEGRLLKTYDHGQNWSEVELGSEKLSAIFFLNSAVGWVSANKKLYSTGDGFNTWQAKDIQQLPGAITSIHFTSNQKGFITCSNVVYKTTDGGNNWAGVGYASSSLKQVNFLNEVEGYAVGDFGTVLHTINGGSLWQVSNLSTTKNIVSVGWTSSGKVYINDEDGNLYRVEQRKVSIVSPTANNQMASGHGLKVTWDCTDNIQKVVVQVKQNGVTIRGIFSEEEFEFNAQNKTANLELDLPTGTVEILVMDKLNRTRVRSVHTITVGNSSAQNWNVFTIPGTIDFQKLSAKSFRTAEDKFYSSTTNGRTWNLIYTMPTDTSYNTHLQKIYFLNSNFGFIVSSYSLYVPPNPFTSSGVVNKEKLLKTIDGGQTWTTKIERHYKSSGIFSGESELIPFVYFIDENNGWIVEFVKIGQNSYGDIYRNKWRKTTDGGTTFTDMTDGFIPKIMQFVDRTTGFCLATNNRIYKSVDRGESWSLIKDEGEYNGIHFLNSNVGFVVGNSGEINKTINGGSSWIAQFSGTSESLESVFVVNENMVYVSGYKTALKTTNGGSNWKILFDGYQTNFTKVECYSATDVLLISGSVFLGTTTGGEPAQIHKENEEKIKIEIPSQFSLSQNYPNPFNPVTQFKYELPDESRVKIRVFNILGETITELVNQIQSSGYYQRQWDGGNNPSGVYLLRMEAESLDGKERFVRTTKMLLLK